MKGGAINSYPGVTGVIRPIPVYAEYMLTLLSYQYISSYDNLFIYPFVEHFLLFKKSYIRFHYFVL